LALRSNLFWTRPQDNFGGVFSLEPFGERGLDVVGGKRRVAFGGVRRLIQRQVPIFNNLRKLLP
jgi:hypothetical protein